MAYITLTHTEKDSFEYAYVNRNRDFVVEDLNNSHWKDSVDLEDYYDVIECFFDDKWFGGKLPLEFYSYGDWASIYLIGDDNMTLDEIKSFVKGYLPEEFPYGERYITNIKYAPSFSIFMEDELRAAEETFEEKAAVRCWCDKEWHFGRPFDAAMWEKWSKIRLNKSRLYQEWRSHRGSDFAPSVCGD